MTQLVVALRYKPEGRGFDFRWGLLRFLLTSSFRPQYGAVVDPVSNIHEYPGFLLGVKALRGDNLNAFMCRLSKNYGILKHLEP